MIDENYPKKPEDHIHPLGENDPKLIVTKEEHDMFKLENIEGPWIQ